MAIGRSVASKRLPQGTQVGCRAQQASAWAAASDSFGGQARDGQGLHTRLRALHAASPNVSAVSADAAVASEIRVLLGSAGRFSIPLTILHAAGGTRMGSLNIEPCPAC